jgi:hypothetical protein
VMFAFFIGNYKIFTKFLWSSYFLGMAYMFLSRTAYLENCHIDFNIVITVLFIYVTGNIFFHLPEQN